MKTLILSLISLFFLVSPVMAESEYYHYVDGNGIKHFTENYTDIPEKYKPQIKVHKSIAPPEQKNDQEKGKAPDTEQDTISQDSLIAQKDALDKKYQDLIEKKNALTAKKGTLSPAEYNLLAKQLNEQVQVYQKESADYEQMVEQYNARVTRVNKASLQNNSGQEEQADQ